MIDESAAKRIFKNNGINPHSSRSHHVFQIRINSYDKLGKPHQSLLNIVDLAGSERRGQFSVLGEDFKDKKKKKNKYASILKKDYNASKIIDSKRPSAISASSNYTTSPV